MHVVCFLVDPFWIGFSPSLHPLVTINTPHPSMTILVFLSGSCTEQNLSLHVHVSFSKIWPEESLFKPPVQTSVWPITSWRCVRPTHTSRLRFQTLARQAPPTREASWTSETLATSASAGTTPPKATIRTWLVSATKRALRFCRNEKRKKNNSPTIRTHSEMKLCYVFSFSCRLSDKKKKLCIHLFLLQWHGFSFPNLFYFLSLFNQTCFRPTNLLPAQKIQILRVNPFPIPALILTLWTFLSCVI